MEETITILDEVALLLKLKGVTSSLEEVLPLPKSSVRLLPE